MPIEPRSNACYILTFIDDFSSYSLVVFIYNKDATLQHFQAMVSWAETFTGHTLTCVCLGHGGEFMAGELKMFFMSKGVTHQTFVPHTPQQNVMQRGSTKLCLKKQKPYATMLVCRNPFGKMLLKLHYILITDNPCIIMIGKHLLNHSKEISLTFPTLGYLEHLHICEFIQINNRISCLLYQRR